MEDRDRAGFDSLAEKEQRPEACVPPFGLAGDEEEAQSSRARGPRAGDVEYSYRGSPGGGLLRGEGIILACIGDTRIEQLTKSGAAPVVNETEDVLRRLVDSILDAGWYNRLARDSPLTGRWR